MCALRTELARREFLFCTPPDNEPIVTFLVGTNRVTDIDVDDAQATARYDDGSITRLRKVDDKWLIDVADDEERIRTTLDLHERAFASGDIPSACALMTEAAQRELERYDPAACGAPSTPETGEFGITQAELVQELGDLRRIEIDGDTAQARYDRSVTTLRRVDGRWLID